MSRSRAQEEPRSDLHLVAMMVVRNEWDRYLAPCLRHLLEYCDEIRILDDASDDDWQKKAKRALGKNFTEKVQILRQEEPTFFVHEGQTRQRLLEWTMEGAPTHILSIDADELVGDGTRIRRMLERYPTTEFFSLNMQEVWKASEADLQIRQDGGWREHPVTILFRAPSARELARNRQMARDWHLPDRALACGRVPTYVNSRMRGRIMTLTDILHFGWACEADRVARHHRYAVADGGKFHHSTHLDSILWGDERVKLTRRRWPQYLDKVKICARASRTKSKMSTS